MSDTSIPVLSPFRRSLIYTGTVRLIWRLRRGGPTLLKRIIDVVVSGLALLLFVPLFGIISALIYLDDPGPILFWQTRVGRHGQSFGFPKFRSMVVDAEAR